MRRLVEEFPIRGVYLEEQLRLFHRPGRERGTTDGKDILSLPG